MLARTLGMVSPRCSPAMRRRNVQFLLNTLTPASGASYRFLLDTPRTLLPRLIIHHLRPSEPSPSKPGSGLKPKQTTSKRSGVVSTASLI